MAAPPQDQFDDLAYTYVWHPINQLSDEERAEVASYTTGGFQRINGALRGHISMTRSLQQSIDTIRTALRRFPLGADTLVTREIGASDIGLLTAADAPTTIAQKLYDAGFLSTSMNRTPPHSTMHIDPIELDLLVPVPRTAGHAFADGYSSAPRGRAG
jgi:ADP-ribosyltransferase exoenzyme